MNVVLHRVNCTVDFALQALCARIADVALCSALHIGVVETFAAVVGHDDRVGGGGWLRRRSVGRDSVSAGNRGVARLMSEAREVMVRVEIGRAHV